MSENTNISFFISSHSENFHEPNACDIEENKHFLSHFLLYIENNSPPPPAPTYQAFGNLEK